MLYDMAFYTEYEKQYEGKSCFDKMSKEFSDLDIDLHDICIRGDFNLFGAGGNLDSSSSYLLATNMPLVTLNLKTEYESKKEIARLILRIRHIEENQKMPCLDSLINKHNLKFKNKYKK